MSRLQTPVRKNDNVVVVAGKDRGKRGRVLKVLPDRNRVVVEGVNFIWVGEATHATQPSGQREGRHCRARQAGTGVEGPAGEASLHASNVQLVCPECGAATRLGRRLLGDGRRVRICRKCDGAVDK